MPKIGALLVGHNTWGGDDPNRGTEREGAFGGAWSGPQFVLAHEPPAEQLPDVTFLDDLEQAVALAREAAGRSTSASSAEPGATNLWFRAAR